MLVPGLVAVAGLLFWAGHETGSHFAGQQQSAELTAKLQDMLQQERLAVEAVRREQRAHLDAIAIRIGQLQGRMMRVDALGSRLVGIGKLDSDEFDFNAEPPIGGVDEPGASSQSMQDIDRDLQRISAMLDDRESKLNLLEGQLLNKELIDEVLPSGRPVNSGWISSSFGKRTDPFTGKKHFHRGIDFASRKGTEVHAVASGVVKRAFKNGGYGHMVEIRHVDGYTTLYAHNQKNLVKKGDLVTKGQTIALLGNTGRSSGPHVHFEVHKDGKYVNPKRYIRAP